MRFYTLTVLISVFVVSSVSAQWMQQPCPQGRGLRGVVFSNEMNGWCISNSYLLHTTDGGNAWFESPQPTFNTNLNDIFMLDTLTGWIVGDKGTILRRSWVAGTVGVKWHEMQSGVIHNLRSVFFTDAKNGWTCGTNGVILATVDGGKTWVQQHIEAEAWKSFYSVFFTDSLTGWATGSVTLKTQDGGKTWTEVKLPSVEGMTDIVFVTPQLGLAVGSIGTILRSTNGGGTWETIESNTGAMLMSVVFADSNEGWVCGGGVYDGTWIDSARVLHTLDGGKTWSGEQLPVDKWLMSIVAVDKYNVWTVGNGSTLLKRYIPTAISEDPNESFEQRGAEHEQDYDLLGRTMHLTEKGPRMRVNRQTGKATLLIVE